jgi:predicted DsbA family dithiol-disulfide isomerase
LQKELDLEVDWRGFELHPETPRGGRRVAELFGEGRMAKMRAYMKEFAAQFGISDMRTPERLPNTRRALAVAELAREQGKVHDFRQAAMDAHWERGQDLENDADLRAVAAAAGLDPEAALGASDDPVYLGRVDAMREEAHDRGVTGIPTFFFGEMVVVGCQPFDRLLAVAKKAGARPRSR